MGARKDFSNVDKVHSHQVGRMLLGISLGEDLPRLPEVADVGPGRDHAQVEHDRFRQANSEFTEGLKIFDVRFGTKRGTAGGELGRLIRECCALDMDARPSLKEVEERTGRIAQMKV